MLRVVALTFLVALGVAPALAAEPPYLKLAQELGTPHLADSAGPRDKSRLLLHFVPEGENATTWTKMTTVSILKVRQADTDQATRSVIVHLRDALKQRHATIETFDESPLPPVTCFFEFRTGDEMDKGIVYSPDPEFVTVVQLAAKVAETFSPDDVKALKAVISK
jgi:hypothetical protein